MKVKVPKPEYLKAMFKFCCFVMKISGKEVSELRICNITTDLVLKGLNLVESKEFNSN